jgi:hypothetical protein
MEGYVQACENLYRLSASMFPNKDPHEHLVIVLCTILTRTGVFKEAEIDKPSQSREIITYTLLPACLPQRIGHVYWRTNSLWKKRSLVSY